ncbi:glycosyltransferase family 2 protein [Aureimonas sp. AU12]|uniref:glycosyltransferase family 2 protein n=1 Tax=Aureimonas sp. AU12 TaxID=1638161 RepID=UPI0007809AC2|nr:glycosyltransferase family 2 protein [Aureimonas sp. AU12]
MIASMPERAQEAGAPFYDPSPTLHKIADSPALDASAEIEVAGATRLQEVFERLGVDRETEHRLRQQAIWAGSTLEDEIVAAGLVSDVELARVIAAVLGVETAPVDPAATVIRDGRGAMQLGQRHLRTCDAALRTRIFISPPLDRLEVIAAHLASNPALREPMRITTVADIRRAHASATSEERSNRARLSLATDFNRWSARDVISPLQSAFAVVAVVALAMAWWHFDGFWLVMHAGCTSLAFVFTAFRLAVLWDTPVSPPSGEALRRDGLASPEGLPIYSVLIALHRESAMAEPLARAMAALDWPRSRLEVFFVCEANDPDTIAAVERAIVGETNFSVIATPRTAPTTKPKALNYALPLARGEFLVLYDAEDRPDPSQLREAYEAFRAGPPTLACLQAPLTIRNASAGWFQALFAMEYAVLFRAILPWLAKRALPLPLGGTSNHFRRATLVEAGGWDSHNVAEDADLGIRLARLGFHVGTIRAPTSESAVADWPDWRNQRTRWIKGWLQTWLVHMRDPRLTIRQLGWRSFLMFQVIFGGMIAASLMHVVFAMHLAAAGAAFFGWGSASMTLGLLASVDALNILLAYLAFSLLADRVLAPQERPLMRRLPTLWFYWLLVSYAGLRAIGQLVSKPHMWEKTPHREVAPT